MSNFHPPKFKRMTVTYDGYQFRCTLNYTAFNANQLHRITRYGYTLEATCADTWTEWQKVRDWFWRNDPEAPPSLPFGDDVVTGEA